MKEDREWLTITIGFERVLRIVVCLFFTVFSRLALFCSTLFELVFLVRLLFVVEQHTV